MANISPDTAMLAVQDVGSFGLKGHIRRLIVNLLYTGPLAVSSDERTAWSSAEGIHEWDIATQNLIAARMAHGTVAQSRGTA